MVLMQEYSENKQEEKLFKNNLNFFKKGIDNCSESRYNKLTTER